MSDEAKKVSYKVADLLEGTARWEDYLTPAPMCIAFLGQLMAISTKRDFSLEKFEPRDGFGPVNNPKSFRACLQQVANVGSDTFSVAHKNMDKIRLQTRMVPEYLQDALSTISEGDVTDIKEILPDELKSIQKASDNCVKLAQEVEQKFDEMMALTGKLLEISQHATGSHQNELREAERERERRQKIKERKELDEERAKQWAEETKKSHRQAEQTYEEAVKNLPDGWKQVGMNVIEGILIVPAIVTAITGSRKFKANKAGEMAKARLETYEKAVKAREKATEELEEEIKALSQLDITKIEFPQLIKILLKGIKNLNLLREKWSQLVAFFQMTSNMMGNIDESVEKICSSGDIVVKRSSEGTSPNALLKKKVSKYASSGAHMCWIMHMISGSYVEVSQKYILHRMAGIGKIMGHDGERDGSVIRRLQDELWTECQNDKKQIAEDVKARQERFNREIETWLGSLKAITDGQQ